MVHADITIEKVHDISEPEPVYEITGSAACDKPQGRDLRKTFCLPRNKINYNERNDGRRREKDRLQRSAGCKDAERGAGVPVVDEVEKPRYHPDGLGKVKVRRNDGLCNLVDYGNRKRDRKKYAQVLSYLKASAHLLQTEGWTASCPTDAL